MKIAKIDEIISNGEVIVYYDIPTGLLISATIDNYFTYFTIDNTTECEFVSSFPITEYVPKDVGDRGETIIEVLINGAKKLAEEIQTNKKAI